jgi:hypothetical protein
MYDPVVVAGPPAMAGPVLADAGISELALASRPTGAELF